jgi:hypothetical protein
LGICPPQQFSRIGKERIRFQGREWTLRAFGADFNRVQCSTFYLLSANATDWDQ